MNKSLGVALIQVLIISAVLAVFCLFLQQNIRFQIDLAAKAKSRIDLRVKLENAESLLFQSLLGHKKYQDKKDTDPIVRNWNFYGESFSISDSVRVTIQDKLGLVNANLANKNLLTNMLVELGYEYKEANHFYDSLEDWKDLDTMRRLNGAEKDDYTDSSYPRNGLIQSVFELTHIKGGQSLKALKFSQYFTTEIASGFNPMNAPDRVLKAYLRNGKFFQQVKSYRDKGELTPLLFYQITGVDSDEYITFATSGFLAVELSAVDGELQITKRIDLKLQPKSMQRPIIIKSVSWKES
ncbi:type II secretion system protein GspK [Pseudoalteromonas xiamenensis]|uniref:type II secretion system protein GspK n=1 Tax=Pseudoalteromonas xiamenensis TaxID=882626 RepID=UPI0027E4B80C|nr:type II secretion system protein GspK [Pseudoalteromonas xiamenensis]WMN61212.1 type II secretion system protein GspK [Pseudoalteromonas xiamenensis]